MSHKSTSAQLIAGLMMKLGRVPLPPKEMDRALAMDLLPQLAESTLPKDQIRLSVALERIAKYRSQMADEMSFTAQLFQEGREQLDEDYAEAKETIANLGIRLKDTERDLHAAQEQRGIYESKRVAELEAGVKAQELKLEEKNRAMMEACAQLAETKKAAQSLLAELEGRKAQAAAYERDIAQLTTAAQAMAEEHRQSISATTTKLRKLLSEAQDKIDDRWPGPKLTPYMELIRNDVVNALKALPP